MNSPMDPAGSYPAHQIAEAAKDRLRKSPYRTVRTVSCKFDHGVLFLSGRLPSYYHKQLAQETVATLQGVAQVVNQAEVVDAVG